ncbi:MAG: cold-shock protein [Jatrophihabitans sp.]|uniref:cold-shock protein n=1 Tax=Jatrophihabitans sp. TaxID=1932789 RepID=UPI003F806A16
MATTTGTVTWFDCDRGYGFIAPDDGGAEVFVHYTALAAGSFKNLAPGERVSFALSQGQRGAQADLVRVIESLENPSEGLQPA